MVARLDAPAEPGDRLIWSARMAKMEQAIFRNWRLFPVPIASCEFDPPAEESAVMRAHLLNWTLGPALLGAIVAAGGADGPAGPAFDALLVLWRGFFGLAGFFGGFYLVCV